MKTKFFVCVSVVGFFLMLGAAGSDCNGECGPGMSIGDILLYGGAGLAMFVYGALGAIGGEQS